MREKLETNNVLNGALVKTLNIDVPYSSLSFTSVSQKLLENSGFFEL